MEGQISLLDMPDDLLLQIFRHLSGWDMLSLMETSPRINNVGKDRTLWQCADFTDGRLSATQIKKNVLPCLQRCTRQLHIRGHKTKKRLTNRWKTEVLTPSLLEKIQRQCPLLESFSLHDTTVNATKLKMIHFGSLSNLRKFCIASCEFLNLPSPTVDGSYFRNTHFFFPYLEHLEICHCRWLTDYDLMILSKVDTIKTLVVMGCVRVGVTIAYMAMSFRFGFKNLETLDMRGTSLQNSDIQSILQGDKIRSLSIGPVGDVLRMNDDYSDGLSLIFPNPQKKEESPHGVVVINMGPDGPNWRMASKEDIENLGLDWVKHGIKIKEKEREDDDVDHYFIGKEGNVISQIKQKDDTAECSTKRKRDDSDSEDEPPSKYPHLCQSDDDSDDDTQTIPPNFTQSLPPDSGLNDFMLHTILVHTNKLEKLMLAGCGVTSSGLKSLAQHVDSLKYVDVSNTFVTKEGLEEAKSLNPHCVYFASHLEEVPSTT